MSERKRAGRVEGDVGAGDWAAAERQARRARVGRR
jgi:hypothetical protein